MESLSQLQVRSQQELERLCLVSIQLQNLARRYEKALEQIVQQNKQINELKRTQETMKEHYEGVISKLVEQKMVLTSGVKDSLLINQQNTTARLSALPCESTMTVANIYSQRDRKFNSNLDSSSWMFRQRARRVRHCESSSHLTTLTAVYRKHATR